MADVWLDVVTPKDALLASCLVKALREEKVGIIVTAKKQTQTMELLKKLGVPYVEVGRYGGTHKEKLVEEQRRILKFVDLFERVGLPKKLWTHGGVDAVRTAFGLQVPVVYSNDTLHAIHVAKLVTPLVDWLIAPKPFGKSWSKYGIPKSRIKLYDGIEEVAWIKKAKPHIPNEIEDLKKENKLIMFRNVEYKASYFHGDTRGIKKLLSKLSKIAKIIYLPRYAEEKEFLKDIENVWIPKKTVIAYELMPAVDIVVGSGGTICRESALLGVPTVCFHFWDVIAQYLARKGFPIYHVSLLQEVVRVSRKALKGGALAKRKSNTAPLLEKMESPIGITVHYLKKVGC